MNLRIANIARRISRPGPNRAMPNRAALITGKADIFYLTGIGLEGFWLVIAKGRCAAIAPPMLVGHLRSMEPDFEVIEADDMAKAVGEFCRKLRLNSLEVDAGLTSLALAGRLKKYIRVIPSSSQTSVFRLRKDKYELSAIKKACKIVMGAFRYARGFCRPGVSEIEIYFKIEEYFAKHKVSASFPTIVAFGPNSANPHHVPAGRKLRKNDAVLLDIGCLWKGYHSDLTRTFFLGKMTKLQLRVFSSVKRAQKAAMKVVKEGVFACKVDAAARAAISNDGYGARFIHSTGHGLGIEIHEMPGVSEKDRTLLKAGMVITVEPGIYLPGRFGVRIEDTVLVTRNGFEILTME